MQELDLHIVYQPGKKNAKADATQKFVCYDALHFGGFGVQEGSFRKGWGYLGSMTEVGL